MRKSHEISYVGKLTTFKPCAQTAKAGSKKHNYTHSRDSFYDCRGSLVAHDVGFEARSKLYTVLSSAFDWSNQMNSNWREEFVSNQRSTLMF